MVLVARLLCCREILLVAVFKQLMTRIVGDHSLMAGLDCNNELSQRDLSELVVQLMTML